MPLEMAEVQARRFFPNPEGIQLEIEDPDPWFNCNEKSNQQFSSKAATKYLPMVEMT